MFASAFALGLIAGAALAAVPALDVPFVRQDVDGCGSASASMIMKYWFAQGARGEAAAADPDAIQRELYAPAAKGIAGTALQKYFERNGFRAFIMNAEDSDLERHLERGRPLIVCFALRASALHFVVLTGYDRASGLYFVNDPARGKNVSYKASEFRDLWKATRHWTLLAVPAQ